jgi:HEAT repeat protein
VALDDEDPRVRSRVAQVLGDRGGGRAQKLLMDVRSREDDPRVIKSIDLALKQIRN